MADLAKIAEELSALTLKEAADLVKLLEEEWGVKAASGGGVMMMAPGAGGDADADAEPTEFNVILAEIGSQKVQVIKEIRAITGLGLKEAKALVDGAPAPIKESVEKDEAEEIKKKVEGAGAKVEIKAA